MPLIWASGCPCHNEATSKPGARRNRPPGGGAPARSSPGFPLPTATRRRPGAGGRRRGGREAPASRMHDYLAARTAFFDRTVVGASAAACGRSWWARPVTTAGRCGTPSQGSAGSRWIIPRPSGTSGTGSSGSAWRRPGAVRRGRLRPGPGGRPAARGRARTGAPSLFLLEGVAVYLEPPSWRPSSGSSARSPRPAAAWPSACPCPGPAAMPPAPASRPRWPRWGSRPGPRSTPAEASAARPDRLALAADEGDGRRQPPGATSAHRRPARWPAPARRHPRRHGPADPTPPKPPRARPPASTQPVQPPQPTALSLSALLSQTLVAYTIEFDNEAEHRLPHRTTSHGASGPATARRRGWCHWPCGRTACASSPTSPSPSPSSRALARTGTNLDGMRRWGYITIDGTAKKIHRGRPGPDAVLRAQRRACGPGRSGGRCPASSSSAGASASAPARSAGCEVPHRLVGQLDPGLPDYLPILGQALLSRGPDPRLPPRPDGTAPGRCRCRRCCPGCCWRSPWSTSAEPGCPSRSAPTCSASSAPTGPGCATSPPLTGISKEAVSWALGILIRGCLAAEEPDPAASRGKVARLTPRGLARSVSTSSSPARSSGAGKTASRRPSGALGPRSKHWPRPRPAAAAVRSLEPYPDNWRASVRRPATLPHYPMVLHRGGYPDGS